MSLRLTKLYTRTGDNGSTSLGNGQRIRKDSLRIHGIGEVDELNSMLGVVMGMVSQQPNLDTLIRSLQPLQHHLFDLGGELAMVEAQYFVMTPEDIKYLEAQIDQFNSELEPLANFILPGGDICAAQLQLARAVCRRAERTLTALSEDESEQVNPQALIYLNRLSDLLFVASRVVVKLMGGEEVLWQSRAQRT